MADTPIDPSEKAQSQQAAFDLLEKLGYAPLTPAETLALRGGRRRNVILHDVLIEQIIALNRVRYRGRDYPLDPADATEAVRKLLPSPEQQRGLKVTNQDVYDRLVLGTTLVKSIDGDTKSHSVRYVDWTTPSNNVFHVTTEFAVERTGSSEVDRLDVVAFVNGIPFVAIECKRPSEAIKRADHQLLRYQRPAEIPAFFELAQLLIATNRREARYATVGTPSKFWGPWVEEDDSDKTIEAITGSTASAQDRLVHALCRPERLLELVRTFTVFDAGERKVARHQQFFAVKRALERVTSGADGAARPGGVIWHTQGSGKSLTMVMLGKALEFHPGIRNPRVILVTDRDDLDRQIRDTFVACQRTPVRAHSGKQLAELIRSKTPLITTIVNKFAHAATWFEKDGVVDDDPDIFVLVDESHRTQTATRDLYGTFATRMRRMLPRANYIGFTGTPLLKKQKNTFQTFGRPIHTYTIDDAVRDEAVVPLLYEGRDIQKHIAPDVLDAWFERLCQGLDDESRRALKRKFSRADSLAAAEQVVWAKAFDISEHYRQHWQGTGFKAQLVAPTKAAAIRFKQVLDEIGHVTSEVVISPPDDDEANEATDLPSRRLVEKFWDDAIRRYGSEAAYNREVVDRFRSSTDPEILIVVSKLLTGFDAPRNTVLYVCRTLREHTLLQAIARVNRLFEPDDDGDPPKEFGYVIDYEGLLGDLDQALTTYASLSDFDIDDLLGAVTDVRAELAYLEARWSAVWDLLRGARDMEAMERLLAPDDIRDEFAARLAVFTRTLHLALSSDKTGDVVSAEKIAQFKADWQLFVQLRQSAAWRYNERPDLREYEPKIRKLLDDHMTALPADIVVPEVNLNDSASLRAVIEDTRASASAKADRIASATRRRIDEQRDRDPALYERFAKLVQDAIDAHRAHRLSEIEYLNRMVELSDEVRGERRRRLPQVVEKDADAPSIFEAIASRFVLSEGLDRDATVGRIAVDLATLTRSRLIVGFWENPDAQNNLLNAIDEYLWSLGEGVVLPPDDEEAVRETVMSIARARFA